METTMNQQNFIENAAKNKTSVNVYLINGVKLHGTIEAYDDNTIVVSGNKGNSGQLVFKHAISTVQISA